MAGNIQRICSSNCIRVKLTTWPNWRPWSRQAAQVHGVLFKIANGQKLQLVVVAVAIAVLFAITPHQVALLLPLLPREFSSLGRFNNVRPFVSHKFAQQFTQYITVVHQVEPQPRIDPQLHMSVGEGAAEDGVGGQRLSPLLNCEMSQHFRLFGKCKCQRLCLRLPPVFLSSFLFFYYTLFVAPLCAFCSTWFASATSQLYLCTWFTARTRIKTYLLCVSQRHATHSLRRFSSQANRYQQFGIVWKLICK